jgi:hypothetical protein
MAGSAGENGGNLGVVENEELGGGDFDFARGHFGVDGVGSAQADLADGGEDVFGADVLGFGMALRGRFPCRGQSA